jgi:hypothetical protein
MTYMTARSVQFRFATSVAVILIAWIGRDAAAKAHKRNLHARNSIYESRSQLAPQQPDRPGAMRYYGGPKSPMWRGPVEN